MEEGAANDDENNDNNNGVNQEGRQEANRIVRIHQRTANWEGMMTSLLPPPVPVANRRGSIPLEFLFFTVASHLATKDPFTTFDQRIRVGHAVPIHPS